MSDTRKNEIIDLDDCVSYDTGDRVEPICVDSDGWMSLEDAEDLRNMLDIAIARVKELNLERA